MASQISKLSAIISSSVSKLDEHVRVNQLPPFGYGSDITLDVSALEKSIDSERKKALDAVQELEDCLQGPIACMLPKVIFVGSEEPDKMLIGVLPLLQYNPTSLQAIYRFDLAEKVPLSGMISFHDLAEHCGLHTVDVRRIIRFAISFHRLFTEPEEGFVAHSVGSRMLRASDTIHAGLGQSFDDFFPSFARTLEAMKRFPGLEPHQTGFALAHDTDQTLFEYLRTNPIKADQFNKAMVFYARSVPGYSESFLVEGYPWNQVRTVVDVGGSSGSVGFALAQAHPRLQITIQDLPEVIREPSARLHLDPKADRISFMEHDFFAEQTVSADAYLFRWVLHDWPDHYVVRILRNLVPALQPGARIVVNESISPKPGFLPLSTERTVRFIDMLMLTVNNSRLREDNEWQAIFTEADTRFGRIACWTPPGAAMAIIEARWQGEAATKD